MSSSPPLLAMLVGGALVLLAFAWPAASRATEREKRTMRSADPTVRHLALPAKAVPFPPASFVVVSPFGGDSAPAFARKAVLADAARPGSLVDIVMWDPSRMTTRWVQGTMEPAAPSVAQKDRAGIVPATGNDALRVRAAFNGGFRGVHGGYGAELHGETILPMKDGLATFVERSDGSNALHTWPLEEDRAHIVSLRQNLPPLVVLGRSQAHVRASEQWGAMSPDRRDRVHGVRSGLCARADGLFAYFWGDELSPEALATVMIDAQCTYGMHLDMNAGMTGFEFCKAKDEVSGSFEARRLNGRMSLASFPLCGGRSPRDFFVLEERTLP